MFYGFTQSTDMRYKNTHIKKFNSEKALKKWLSVGSGGYTYSDPDAARNYHHTFKYGFEHVGRIDYKHQIFMDHGTPTYPSTKNDQIARYLRNYGRSIES